MPLFTSLLNIIFAYDPIGYGLPYNYLMFTDSREQLVEVSCQLLCVALETNISISRDQNETLNDDKTEEPTSNANLFISYISRIHRDEVSCFFFFFKVMIWILTIVKLSLFFFVILKDFAFILKGFCRLLNNPMTQTFLPGSCKRINFFQELLILFWKFCDLNKVIFVVD